MNTSLALRVAAPAVASLFASAPAAAALFFCTNNYAPGTPGFNAAFTLGSGFCASAHTSGGSGWSSMVLAPDAAGATPVNASQSGSSGGAFAASATGSSSAAPGLLRGAAGASAFGSGEAYSSGDGEASFLDRGTLAPSGGAAAGSPVALRLTMDVGGAFLGTGGGGDVAVKVYRNGVIAYERPIVLNLYQTSFLEEVDLQGFVVGDDVALWMRLRAFAGAADTPPTASSSSADLSNSAHLYLDVVSGNASFDATSDHDYSFVPEPAAPVLLCAGAAVLAAARRSRARAAALPSHCGGWTPDAPLRFGS